MPLPAARNWTGWLRAEWSPTPVRRLRSNLPDITDELFAVLRFVSEVPEAGKLLVKEHCADASETEIDERYTKVRACSRQAENYYRAAQKLHYRSAALLYYYAFLNLAKAVLEVRGFVYDQHHGLRDQRDSVSIDLAMQNVKILKRGVFPSLYEQEFQVSLPTSTSLDVRSLLAYASDIAYQYGQAGFGTCAVETDCRARVLVHQGNGQMWYVLAVPKGYEFADLPEPNKTTFTSSHQEVQFPLIAARETFGLFAEQHAHHRYYESRPSSTVTPPIALLYTPLRGFIEPKYIDDTYDFTLAKPLGMSGHPMNECLAIYLVMFFLGSLVRYRPDYLDSLLDTTAAWTLEGLVMSTPLTALRAFISKITGTVFIFNR